MNFKRQSFWKGKKMVVTDIGKRIRLAREIAGFTQENLAEAVDVSRTAVARWESGDIVPNLQHIVDIAMLLNVSTDYLLGVKGSDENKTARAIRKSCICPHQIYKGGKRSAIKVKATELIRLLIKKETLK